MKMQVGFYGRKTGPEFWAKRPTWACSGEASAFNPPRSGFHEEARVLCPLWGSGGKVESTEENVNQQPGGEQHGPVGGSASWREGVGSQLAALQKLLEH